MKHVALTLSSCVLALGLVACDKKGDAEPSAEAKTEDKQEPVVKAEAAKQDEKPAPVAEPPPAVPDDTKGVGGVVHAAAGDAQPAAPTAPADAAAPAPTDAPAPADAPHFDASKDKGGMIRHLAGGLAHDEELTAGKNAMATLASLVVGDETPSDADICGHVWKTIFVKEFPDTANAELEAEFMEQCKFEIEKERLKLGPEVFAEAAACIMAAQDLEAIELCDKAEEEAEQQLHEQPHGDGLDKQTCEAAVAHMFALLRKDLGADAALLETLEEDLKNLEADAVLMCMDTATKAEIDCLMKAQDLAAVEACE